MGKYHASKSVESCEKDQNSALSSYNVGVEFMYKVNLVMDVITNMVLCELDPIRVLCTSSIVE